MTAILTTTAAKSKRAPARPQDRDREVGAKLRDLRMERGLTQQKMAALIGVTYQQLHKYEKGINRISAGRLWQILEQFKVEPAEFFALPATARRTGDSQRALEMVKVYRRLPPETQIAVTRFLRALGQGEG